MKIIYKQGDLIKDGPYRIAHGCNAQGVMRSGIAKQMRETYPEVYTAYSFEYAAHGLNLGDVVPAYINYPNITRIVFNLITQEYYGRDPNTVYVSYDAVRDCIKSLNTRMGSGDHYETPEIGFPLIGAGLANGDWDIISKIIEEESTDFQPIVFKLD
jgi:O-acetyl-ADP-ribose deacetylase (regulator of RNase III)